MSIANETRQQMKSFLNQGFINLFGNAVASFLAFLFNFLVVKNLSMSDYGEYTSIIAYLAFFTAPLTILALIVTKKVSQVGKEEKVEAALRVKTQFFTLMRKYSWIFLTVPIWWWLLSQYANFDSFLSVPTILLLLLISLMTTVFTAILTGWQAFVIIVMIAIITASLKLLGGWVGLSIWTSLNMVDGILIFSGTAQLFLTWRWAKKHWQREKKAVKNPSEKELKLGRYLKQRSFWVPLSGVLITTALINVDMMTVKVVGSADFAGAYGLYSLFGRILLYASNPLINVAFTFFNQKGEERQKKLVFALSVALIGFFALGMVALYAWWPELLITVVGKSDYLVLAPELWLAAIFGGLYSLALLLAQYLIAKNRRLIFYGALMPLLQIAGIYYYHQTLTQVMLVNIVTTTILIIIYGAGVIYKQRRHAQATI